MNLGGLAKKVGGVAKEATRNGLISGVIDISGNNGMLGNTNYSEYLYDASGHIKGINSVYAKEITNKFEELGLLKESEIDGAYDGLTSGVPRKDLDESQFLSSYPVKYKLEYTKNKNNIGSSKFAGSTTINKLMNDSKVNEAINNAPTNTLSNATKNDNDKSLGGLLYNDVSTNNFKDYNKNQNKIINDPYSDTISLKLPDWTYADFINERAIWQKGLSSIFDEPGWFYFKIFFDFDTSHGLFGGLLNAKYLTNAVNSAAKYLYTVRNIHKRVKPLDRINALYKFASILSYINTNAPWYFKSVKGLNEAANPIINEFSKERTIEIEVTQDAIDMRLSTIMSLYNYACYDQLLSKEIIPSNLRKFNMSVIVFQAPLRYLHTSYTSNQKTEFMGINVGNIIGDSASSTVSNALGIGKKGKVSKVNYKSMNPNHGQTDNFADTMSMKAYTFIGCEFVKDSFGNIMPGSMSNEKPFQLGNSSIKISYATCTEHTMNEFYGMLFGNDGFYFNQYSNFQLSVDDGKSWNGYHNRNKQMWQKQVNRYKALSDTFEDIAQGGTILGLVDKPKTYKKAIDATEAIMNGLFDNSNLLSGLATNFALGLLGSSRSVQAPQGNIYGDYGIGSAYFKDKLEMLKKGVHERTTAPYYYDPINGVIKDHDSNRMYSAYEFTNDLSSIRNFDLSNWLNTRTQNMASGINDILRGSDNDNTTAPYIPNPYNSQTAQNMDDKRFEGIGKDHSMVDDPKSWDRVEQPFKYNANEAISYESGKQIDQNNGNTNDIKGYDENGNPIHLFGEGEKSQFVQDPYKYNEYNRLTAQEIDEKRFEGIGKDHSMVDDPNTWDRVQEPYNS